MMEICTVAQVGEGTHNGRNEERDPATVEISDAPPSDPEEERW